MTEFKPNKLFVDFKKGVTQTEPIVPRCYTLTHSDLTADLYLSIGITYDTQKITPMRDEVLADWVKVAGEYTLEVYLHVDGAHGLVNTTLRDEIFRRELPLALTAIRYGDRKFFEAHKNLDDAPIIVHFNSVLPEFMKTEGWGKLSDYIYGKDKGVDVKRANKEKGKLREDVIVTLLNQEIEAEVIKLYQGKQPYCLQEVQILDIQEKPTSDYCKGKFLVVVGLRVGKNPPPYNNMIIEFLVKPNGVETKSVKNPRI